MLDPRKEIGIAIDCQGHKCGIKLLLLLLGESEIFLVVFYYGRYIILRKTINLKASKLSYNGYYSYCIFCDQFMYRG